MNPGSQFDALAPAKVLIIKPSALGDVVQALPILPALQQRYPSAQFSWVIQRGLEDLVAGHPDLAAWIPYHRQGGWRAWRTLLAQLWRERFDLVIDLQGLLRTGVMTAFTRAPVRLGLGTAREGAHWTVTHTLPNTGKQVPAGERYLRVVDALGGDRTFAALRFQVSDSDQEFAQRMMSGLPRPCLAVHPGARWETKRWPTEKFADVLTRAIQTWQASVILLGSRAEQPETSALARELQARNPAGVIADFAGQTTLKQLGAVLQRVDAVISNDSGPMHLAAGLGTPTLGIFTCTDAIRSGPTGDRHVTVSTQVACAGSYRKVCPHSGEGHHACFRELEAERVWLGLQQLYDKNRIDAAQRPAA